MRRPRHLIYFFFFAFIALSAGAQSAPEYPVEMGEKVFYVVSKGATAYASAGTDRPYLKLSYREPVFVISSENGWNRIRTQDGMYGYVPDIDVSNIWIRVSKVRKRLFLYEGMRLLMDLPADFGFNAYSDKVRMGSEGNRDDWRTPEGAFFVVRKNPYSRYHKAFLLNYPNAEDADRGLKSGLINRAQYQAIMSADRTSTVPPMGTQLGGMIEIHGDGTGLSTNWTQGCVAVTNEDMDRMWNLVQEGTPVIIEK